LAWRRICAVLGPLSDASLFCVLLSAGTSLRTGHWLAFTVGVALTWLGMLPWPHLIPSQATAVPGSTVRVVVRVLAVTLMAGLLRGGLLGLLIQRAHWPPPAAIILGIALGLAVTLPGYRYALSVQDDESRRRAFAIGLVAYAWMLRLVFAGSVELLPEETY
jgi:dolichol-phosphate mannosyltransferase